MSYCYNNFYKLIFQVKEQAMSFYQYIGDLDIDGNRKVFVKVDSHFNISQFNISHFKSTHITPLTMLEMEETLKRAKGFQRQSGISIVTKFTGKDNPNMHVWVWDEEHRDSYPYYTPFGKLIEHINKGDIIQPVFELALNETRLQSAGDKFVLSSLVDEPTLASSLRVIRAYFTYTA